MPLRRRVSIRDPRGEFETQEALLLCTDLDADPERILWRFVRPRQTLASGGNLPRSPAAPRVRDAQRHWPERAILRTAPALCRPCSRWLRFSPTGTWQGTRMPPDEHGSVAQAPSALLLRCAGAGAQGGVVGARRGGNFLRVVLGDRGGKSPEGLRGKANRRGLLRTLTAKFQLRMGRIS